MGRRWNISEEEARLEGEVLEERLARADRQDAPLLAEQLSEPSDRVHIAWSAGPFELVLEETGSGAPSASGLMESLLIETGWRIRSFARAAFSGRTGSFRVVGEDEEVWTFNALSRTELHVCIELDGGRLQGALDVVFEPDGATTRCAPVDADADSSAFLITLELLERLASVGGSLRFSRSNVA